MSIFIAASFSLYIWRRHMRARNRGCMNISHNPNAGAGMTPNTNNANAIISVPNQPQYTYQTPLAATQNVVTIQDPAPQPIISPTIPTRKHLYELNPAPILQPPPPAVTTFTTSTACDAYTTTAPEGSDYEGS